MSRFIYSVVGFRFLTHWGRDKIDAISQTTFSNAFAWMKIFEFRLIFHFVLKRITQHWFGYWLGHYLNRCWPSSLTHICCTRWRCVNAAYLSSKCHTYQNIYDVLPVPLSGVRTVFVSQYLPGSIFCLFEVIHIRVTLTDFNGNKIIV